MNAEASSLRRWLSYGATLVAAVTSIATSYGSDNSQLSLPEQSFTLDAEHPTYRSRFAVESDDGRFNVWLRYHMATGMPEVQFQTAETSATRATIRHEWTNRNGPGALIKHFEIEAECPKVFPCVTQFEATTSAPVAAPSSLTGTLQIEVEMYQSGSKPEGTYLGVEQLP